MFLVKSHVPSPTVWVSDEYELDPGGERVSAGAMAAMRGVVARIGRRSGEKQSRQRSRERVVCAICRCWNVSTPQLSWRSGERWTEWRGSGCRCLIGVFVLLVQPDCVGHIGRLGFGGCRRGRVLKRNESDGKSHRHPGPRRSSLQNVGACPWMLKVAGVHNQTPRATPGCRGTRLGPCQRGTKKWVRPKLVRCGSAHLSGG